MTWGSIVPNMITCSSVKRDTVNPECASLVSFHNATYLFQVTTFYHAHMEFVTRGLCGCKVHLELRSRFKGGLWQLLSSEDDGIYLRVPCQQRAFGSTKIGASRRNGNQNAETL